jgi:hypothetical protein
MGAAVIVPSIIAALAATATGIESNQQAQHAKGAEQAAAAQQFQQSQALQTQLNQQPKAIAPDNFLAVKAGQLANLRLGLASTITGSGSGGVPSPVLSWNSLQPGGGKNKLGT